MDQTCRRVGLSLPFARNVHRYVGQPVRALDIEAGCRRRCLLEIAVYSRGRRVGSAKREIKRGSRARLVIALDDEARQELAQEGQLTLRLAMNAKWGLRLRNQAATGYLLRLHDPPQAR